MPESETPPLHPEPATQTPPQHQQPPRVHGLGLDAETRCVHWHSPLDIIAIRMKCCGRYYACMDCHDALEAHPLEPWPESEWHRAAVLCGACGRELTIHAYLACRHRCPGCSAPFNPGCRHHYAAYFTDAAR